MSDAHARAAAETAAIEMLRDLVGPDYSDTTLRVATDHLLSFHRSMRPTTHTVSDALRRLLEVAKSDTGQSARVARFLMAWWNGDDLGHFPIADLFGVDAAIASDITLIVLWLGSQPAAVYPDAFGRRSDMQDVIERWGALKPA